MCNLCSSLIFSFLRSTQVVASLKANIAEERKLCDEVLQGKSGLESQLQKKIDQLSHDIVIAQKNAEAAVQEKNQQLERMNVAINTSKAAVVNEAEKN